MKITPSSEIAGARIVETLGLVKGSTIRTRHLGKDITAVFKHMIGGEIEEYTKMMGEAREQAIGRMKQQAEELGADAVTDIRFSTAYVMSGAAEVIIIIRPFSCFFIIGVTARAKSKGATRSVSSICL